MFLRVLPVFVAAAIGLGAVACGDDEGGGGGGGEANQSQLCQLAASGLELLAQRIHQGEEIAALVKLFGPGACVQLVKAVVNEPFEPVSVEVELPDGESSFFSGTGEELIAPAPEPEPAPNIDLNRLIACVQSYSIQFLVDECYEGLIEP